MARDDMRWAIDPLRVHAELQRNAGRSLGPILSRPDLGVAGTTTDIQSGPTAAIIAQRQVLRLIGSDPEATSVAVMADATLVNPTGIDDIFDAFLTVAWGTGGARHSVEVDLGPRGTFLTVSGSVIEVVASWFGQGTLRVNVSAGYAGAQPPQPPTRTRRTDTLAALATFVFSVPSMAAVVRMMRAPQTEPYTFEFRRASGTAIAAGVVAAGVGEAQCRVPPDAQSLAITNTGAGVIGQFRAIFEVLL